MANIGVTGKEIDGEKKNLKMVDDTPHES